MLTTALTRRFAIDHPIIQAGMGAEAGPELAAAVSEAGGLGTLGTIATPPDAVAAAIRRLRDLTARPFSVNVVAFEQAMFAAANIETVLAERPPSVTLSFGEPARYLRRFRDVGIPVLVQVQDLAAAHRALDEGVDALIVQGHEAGGHTGFRGTLSFVAEVLEFAGNTPVIAAGGVANGRGLAAALAMGAAGAVLGTRFKATPEFHGSDVQKQAIVASTGDGTLADLIFDRPIPFAFPDGIVGRALRGQFSEKWEGRDEALKAAVAALPPREFLMQLAQDPASGANWAGESSGLVNALVPAGELVREIAADAERLLLAAAAAVT
ncbi:MAG: nitronate monooxygenase [Chloroflexi bacterium]|nr:nitronate monooxygenase [Chloroflexota bacterium]